MNDKTGFTEDQIKTLNEISQLGGEEKKKRLEVFFNTLSDEQKALLKTKSCIYCGIVNGKVASFKVYEDDVVVCVMDVRPATKGHVIVVPKKHFFVSGQMDDETTKHVFNVTNKISRVLFETMGAEGTNILVSNGFIAGQRVEHFVVHVIPRYEGDKVVIGWEGVSLEEKELREYSKKIKQRVQDVLGSVKNKIEKINEEEVEEELDYDDEKRLP